MPIDPETPRDMAELEEFEQELAGTPPEEPAVEPDEPTEAAADTVPAEEAPPEPTAEPDELEPPAEEEPVPEQTEPDPLEVPYTFRGQTRSLKEWMQSGEDLAKIFTNANQSAHLQQKWREMKEAEKAAQARAQQEQQKQQTSSPEAMKTEAEWLKTNVAPGVLELAKAGAFEPDIAEDYPIFVARIARMLAKGTELEARLRRMESRENERLAKLAQEDDARHIEGLVSTLAQSGEAFSGLADSGHQVEFFTWLANEDNPWGRVFKEVPTQQVEPQHMQALYGQFLAATGATPPVPKRRPSTPAAAAGASSGGGRRTPLVADEFAEFEAEMRRHRLA